MVLNLINLNEDKIRDFMLSEFENDIKTKNIYRSPRLKDGFYETYFDLVRAAIKEGNDSSLAEQIDSNGCIKAMTPRKLKSGTKMVKVPHDAHITLSEGEFNRFYLRGICLKAIENNLDIEVYRAKAVRQPRPESQAMLGKRLNPEKLLDDLRKNIGIDTALGLPRGPNSGLSGKLVEK